jgi:hypothetical protein
VLPLGLAYAPTAAWRIYVELGAFGGGSVNHGVFNAGGGHEAFGWGGGYGAVAVSRAWTKR